MARPTECPACHSIYWDIHALVYPFDGSYEGKRCENSWHRSKDYDPDILVLTDADRKMLKENLIGV